MVNHWSSGVDALVLGLADHVVEEGVVQPECVAEARCVFAVNPLLPVEPPEIDSLFLEWTDDRIEIGIGPVLVIDSERHRSLASVGIDVTLRAVVVGSS